MEYRSLGGTGVKVSPLCLGAMMFGAGGNTDHDDSVRIIHAALDTGVNFVELVGPGTNVDAGWTSPALAPGARRR